jgi:hypothetical protein
MKKLILLASILVLASTSCQTSKEDNKMSVDEIKKLSTVYHERNLEDVDNLLSDDFVGSFYYQSPSAGTWNKEDHKNAIARNPNVKDSILFQIAEDDWVAERFIRIFENEDTIMKAEIMQFKQIKNGKFISSWELVAPIN